MLEHLRAELARDPAHLVKGAPYGLLGFVDLVTVRRCGAGDRVEVEQHAGQHLADLVVEVACDADPLGLLCGQDASRTLPALALEPVEHSIESDDNTTDLVATQHLQPLTRAKQVDGLHSLCQSFERVERPSQERGIRGQRERECGHDDERLGGLDRRADRHGAEEEKSQRAHPGAQR